jgi:hypothetical protein
VCSFLTAAATQACFVWMDGLNGLRLADGSTSGRQFYRFMMRPDRRDRSETAHVPNVTLRRALARALRRGVRILRGGRGMERDEQLGPVGSHRSERGGAGDLDRCGTRPAPEACGGNAAFRGDSLAGSRAPHEPSHRTPPRWDV